MKTLLSAFIEKALGYEKSVDSGDHRGANRFHDRLMALKAKSNQEEFRDVCRVLLESDNETVRLWAATFYLKEDEQRAALVLEELKTSARIVGLTAASTLDLWKTGLLK
jgi:hypothetical protein